MFKIVVSSLLLVDFVSLSASDPLLGFISNTLGNTFESVAGTYGEIAGITVGSVTGGAEGALEASEVGSAQAQLLAETIKTSTAGSNGDIVQGAQGLTGSLIGAGVGFVGANIGAVTGALNDGTPVKASTAGTLIGQSLGKKLSNTNGDLVATVDDVGSAVGGVAALSGGAPAGVLEASDAAIVSADDGLNFES